MTASADLTAFAVEHRPTRPQYGPMFVLAKLLDFVTQPLAWVVLLLLLGLLLPKRWQRSGRTLLWSALAVLLLQGWEPLPDAVLRSLERQYPGPAQPDLSRYA